MERIDRPASLTPTGQQSGLQVDPAEANRPGSTPPPSEIPVGTQPQPSVGVPSGEAAWRLTATAGA